MARPALPLIINGWAIFAHPLFLDQVEALLAEVEREKRKDPKGYRRKNVVKRLAAIEKLAFESIPQDPQLPAYRQGASLGGDRKHWFRAKFFQQYRLFFRFHKSSKTIVYAWVNDEATKRAYQSKADAYRVFQHMLEIGNPPDDWEDLLAEAKRDMTRIKKFRK